MLKKNSQFFISLAVLLAACVPRPLLLHQQIETVPEPGELHIAQLMIEANDPRQINLYKCFEFEPMVEFYDSTDTHRIFNSRKLSPLNLAERRDLSYFHALKDFTVLILTIPKDNGVLLRSFRFDQERVVEGFIAKDQLNCAALFNWLNWLKVLSLPDNAYIFYEQKQYLGRTPRWVSLRPGQHEIQVETLDDFIGKSKITLPGKIEITLQKKQ